MLDLIEFAADHLGRARRFWEGLLGVELDDGTEGEGSSLQTYSGSAEPVSTRARAGSTSSAAR